MNKCEGCGKEISEKVEEFSKKNYSKALCMDCQKIVKQSPATTEIKKETKIPELVDKDHIINLQGKQYITHAGLLQAAHKIGLKAIDTEMIDRPNVDGTIIFKAIVTTLTGVYTGWGDANDKNVNRNIAPHKIRMAETRAINRALRFATNIGMCSLEELGELGSENDGVKTSTKD